MAATESEELDRANGQGSAIRAVCWNLLRMAVRVWAFRLDVASGDRTNDLQYAEVEGVCRMLGFDLAALRAQAAKVISYAKTWADAVTDDWATLSSTNASDAVGTKTVGAEPAGEGPGNDDLPRPKNGRRERNAHKHIKAAGPEA